VGGLIRTEFNQNGSIASKLPSSISSVSSYGMLAQYIAGGNTLNMYAPYSQGNVINNLYFWDERTKNITSINLTQ